MPSLSGVWGLAEMSLIQWASKCDSPRRWQSLSHPPAPPHLLSQKRGGRGRRRSSFNGLQGGLMQVQGREPLAQWSPCSFTSILNGDWSRAAGPPRKQHPPAPHRGGRPESSPRLKGHRTGQRRRPLNSRVCSLALGELTAAGASALRAHTATCGDLPGRRGPTGAAPHALHGRAHPHSNPIELGTSRNLLLQTQRRSSEGLVMSRGC